MKISQKGLYALQAMMMLARKYQQGAIRIRDIADQLRVLIDRDIPHRALYQVFLDVRDAAAHILEHTTLADLISGPKPRSAKGGKRKRKSAASVLPMVVGGSKGE